MSLVGFWTLLMWNHQRLDWLVLRSSTTCKTQPTNGNVEKPGFFCITSHKLKMFFFLLAWPGVGICSVEAGDPDASTRWFYEMKQSGANGYFFHCSFQAWVKSRIWRWKCGFFSWVFSGNGNMSSEKVHAKFCFHFDGRFPARCYHLHICTTLRPFRFSWTRYTRKVWNVRHPVRWSIQVFRSATWRRCGILTAINWKTFITIRKRIDHSTQKSLCTTTM